MDNILLFELWHDCNVKCKYCYLRKLSSTKEEKIESLDRLLVELDKRLAIDNSIDVISFIGGEMYQGQMDADVKSRYLDIIEYISKLVDSGKISKFWTTASLTDANLIDLYDTLSIFNDYSKVKICTSYDTIGRFHTTEMLDNWKTNMYKIKNQYDGLSLNTTMILTGNFMKSYILNTMLVKDFAKTYDTTIYLKVAEAIGGMEFTLENKQRINRTLLNDFYPTRRTALEFLRLYRQNETDLDYYLLHDNENRADVLVKLFNKKNKYQDELKIKKRYKEHDKHNLTTTIDENGNDVNLLLKDDVVGSCGHNKSYCTYVDSDRCFICDKNMFI